MEDQRGSLITNSKLTCVTSQKITSKVSSVPNTFTKSLSHVASKDQIRKGVGGHVALFLLKVAALETTRRLSRAKCPFVWHGFQAFQMLCYPPFKWIQRWAPFKGLVQGMQMFSRPFLVLSIATAFSDKYEKAGPANDREVSDACADIDKETFSGQPCARTTSSDEISNCPSLENWLVELYEELEKQGINLPERINENELRRFYNAADGNFPCLLSSIKKNIRWRETYTILSQQELKMWSNVVFWHGNDVRHRPYLIVRLGLAYSSLPARDRPRFAQAIVSQMEHGVYQANHEKPCIMVLVDCEGLSPFRLPMQMMRSCCLLFQDHFPNCLGGLYVIRLPSVVRMMAQTFIKMLKPVTQQKLKFIGERYQEVLSDYFPKLPAYLDGKCTCSVCSSTSSYITQQFSPAEVANNTQLAADGLDYSEDIALHSQGSEVDIHLGFDQLLRTGMMGILMFCVCVALIAGMYDPESRSNLFS